MSSLVIIDGGILEGGGQILRIATALSVLLKKPIQVNNIRTTRNNPGLRPQHLTGLNLVANTCGAKLTGGYLGSTQITFRPGTLKGGQYYCDTQSAGSVVLLLQLALPCLCFAPEEANLTLKGGTNADMAPPIDWFLMVFKPIIEEMGVRFDCDIVTRGYYPKGGGEIKATTRPVKGGFLNPIILEEPGKLSHFYGYSYVAGVLPVKVANEMADTAEKVLRKHFPGVQGKVDRVKEPQERAMGTGSGIVVVAETDNGNKYGASALGRRHIPPFQVGDEAALELVEDINNKGCVDKHMQDQLIIFMALAKGKSRVKCGPLTLHTKTAIHVIEQMTDVKFDVTSSVDGNTCVIECEGLGHKII